MFNPKNRTLSNAFFYSVKFFSSVRNFSVSSANTFTCLSP